MTPLAHMIVRDSILPVSNRRYTVTASALRLLEDVHFFECSGVSRLADKLSCKIIQNFGCGTERYAFLPASRTFLEWKSPEGISSFALVERVGSDQACVTAGALHSDDTFRLMPGKVLIPLHPNSSNPQISVQRGIDHNHANNLAQIVYGLLACINTPRTIGRKQYLPHAGLQRSLARTRGLSGKFPLQGYTEVVLEVRLPDRSASGQSSPAYLTGQKALHFCRSYARVQNGQVVIVSDCWRGSAFLGIKQTRYSVIPPQNGRPLPPHFGA